MKANIGSADRVIRIVLGLLLLSLIFLVEGPGRWWGLLGIVLIATALIRFCPAYAVLGTDTCHNQPPVPGQKH
ncbi:DUF2892 domain-containing protein [Thermithiobacillus plumbiphilus]|uniref:DUF2892 domain-containing protein n=1 Tax=Thermithiobacillus plumbiphilus TaxID=1729899 RepID=A0ABU9DAZ5_9PROT